MHMTKIPALQSRARDFPVEKVTASVIDEASAMLSAFHKKYNAVLATLGGCDFRDS